MSGSCCFGGLACCFGAVCCCRSCVSVASGRPSRACLGFFALINAATPSKVAKHPRGHSFLRARGSNTGSGGRAVNIALLGAWRRRILAACLQTSDDGLVNHICELAGEARPPPMACIGRDGSYIGSSSHAISLASEQRLTLLVADSGGEAVLLGVSGQAELWIWDARVAPGPCLPRALARMAVSPSCAWLDADGGFVAAGCADGEVHVFAFADGQLIRRCEATILESTRWITVGHRVQVQAISGAPSCSSASPRISGGGVGGSFMSSVDFLGIVCLWKQDGHCIMCADASEEVETLGSNSHSACLAVAQELLICGLTDAIVGFVAPSGERAFVLSARRQSPPSSLPPDVRIVGVVCAQGLDLGPVPSLVAAFMLDGSLLSWDIKALGSSQRCAASPRTVVAPCDADSLQGIAIAVSGHGRFCWLSTNAKGGMVVRWLDLASLAASSGGSCHRPETDGACVFEATLRSGAEQVPLRAVAVLPQQLALKS